jgi:hypothetical protein
VIGKTAIPYPSMANLFPGTILTTWSANGGERHYVWHGQFFQFEAWAKSRSG